MTHADLEAVNGPDAQEEIAPSDGDGAVVEGDSLKLALPPYSYQMIRLKV